MFVQKLKLIWEQLNLFYHSNRWFRNILKIGISLILVGLVVINGFYLAVLWGAFGKVPDKATIQNFRNNTASEVYSADSVLLGKYYLQERTNAEFEELPEHLIQSLVATEDVRFYKHGGVDLRSLARVALKTLLLQNESSGGGSTLTQQLAKNIFPRENRGVLSLPVSKLKEMITARRIESIYSKAEILTLYLNTVSFGHNAFGIETAARRFFDKSPQQLNVQESAVLVGMLKATTLYNPHRNPETSTIRRNVVLQQLKKYNFINHTTYDSLAQLPLEVHFTPTSHNEGIATYFREFLRSEVQNWLKQEDAEQTLNLYTDGLKIYTTIDSKLQQYAEEAVQEHMGQLQAIFNEHWGKTRPWKGNTSVLVSAIRKSPRYKILKAQGLPESQIQEEFKKPYPMTIFTWDGEQEVDMSPLDSIKHYLYFLNAGFMAMDPKTGAVKAWVGGINHKYFKYDHVNVQTKRQVGSIFKPVVYAAALENGVSPCDFVSSKRVTYTNFDDWTPGNANHNYEGYYSVKGALAQSVNTVSVKVLKRTRIKNAVDMAKKMGITSEIPEVPSIALGTPNLSLFEMVGAFGAFANQGIAVKPQYLGKIARHDGRVIADFTREPETEPAMSSRTAQLMLQMMKNVVDHGTAQRIRSKYGLKNDIAGKTGTTQSHADGWFVGITPKLVAGAWVGSDDPNIHFRTITYGQGAAMALPIWSLFMQKVNGNDQFDYLSSARFPNPSAELREELDCVDFKEQRDLYYIFQQILGNRKKRPERKKRRSRKRKY